MGIHNELDLLIPKLRKRVEKTFKALEKKDILVLVSETLRDTEVQQAYYAQGRKSLEEVNALRAKAGLYLLTEAENNKTITNCDGVTSKSNHQARDESGLGYAIDIVPAKFNARGYRDFWWTAPHEVWEEIGKIAEENGLDWCYGGKGNRWGWDEPHFELLEGFVDEDEQPTLFDNIVEENEKKKG